MAAKVAQAPNSGLRRQPLSSGGIRDRPSARAPARLGLCGALRHRELTLGLKCGRCVGTRSSSGRGGVVSEATSSGRDGLAPFPLNGGLRPNGPWESERITTPRVVARSSFRRGVAHGSKHWGVTCRSPREAASGVIEEGTDRHADSAAKPTDPGHRARCRSSSDAGGGAAARQRSRLAPAGS
jgi:hypothetical protein